MEVFYNLEVSFITIIHTHTAERKTNIFIYRITV